MNYQEKKKEELKKERKEEFPEEEATKECPACHTINLSNANFCQECGHKFFKEGSEKPKEPAPQIVQEKKEEKVEEKKEEVKEEVKEKKKSFFSQAQIESIRKSEEEMKNKEETVKEVKAVEVKKVQKAVYVTDRVNYRIQKFTSEGEFITKWGREGSGDGEFERQCGIDIDSQGNVYVVSSKNRIQKFTSEGEFITKWGREGSGDGEFSSFIFGVAISKK